MNRPGAWLASLPDLHSSLLGDERDPITLLLGAGASLSSGTPTTNEVVGAIRKAYPNRFKSDEAVFENLVEIQEKEKRRPIERLFKKVQPFVGYRMLAAMARTRPVTVINLNWDDCVCQAAHAEGVACFDHDIAEPVADIWRSIKERDAAESGIVCIHIHGRLRRDGEKEPRYPLRFATLETLEIKGKERLDLLAECFNAATLVAGTSLNVGRERDTNQLIDALYGTGDGSQAGPFWMALREEEGASPAKTIPAVVHARGGDLDEGLRGPDLDFDRLMWSLRAADAGYTWDEGIRQDEVEPASKNNRSQIALPSEAEMILAKPTLLRRLLAERPPVVVLPGRARQGKSTVAHQFAHWLSLLEVDPPPVSTRRRKDCADAFTEIEPGAIMVLDEPFGEAEYRPAPSLYHALQTLTPGNGTAIVATRHESFARATQEALDAGDEPLPQISSDPADWWAQSTLEMYAEQLREGAGERVRADPTNLNTPLRVRRAAHAKDGEQVEADDPEEIARWLRDELREGIALAALRVIVRLQDFYGPVAADELWAAVGVDPDEHPRSALGGTFRTFQVDANYLRLGSQEDVDAVDAVIKEDRQLVESSLERFATKLPWVLDSLDVWDAVVGDVGFESPDEIDERALTEWTFELAQQAAARSVDDAWALLERARETAPDSWAMREVVFAAACQWRTIEPDDRAEEFISEVLRDRDRRGTYALLEALLRLQANPPVDLVAHFVIALWKLVRSRDADEELLLIFDGLLWKPLRVGDYTRKEIFKLLLARARGSGEMRAAFAAAAAYHRAGAQFLIDTPGLDNPLRWASHAETHPGLVSRLVQWHVVHQARVHAVMTRESFRAADSGEIRMLQRKRCYDELEPDQAEAFRELTAGLVTSEEHAGWGINFALNVNATTGAFDTRHLVDAIDCVPDDDPGLAACAFYEPTDDLRYGLTSYLKRRGRSKLLEILGSGLEFDADGNNPGARIASPRFFLVANGWDVREWWSIPDNGLGERLGVSLDEPRTFLQALGDHLDEAEDWGGDPDGLKRLMLLTERGDTRALELVAARPPAGEPEAGGPSNIATILAAASLILGGDGGS